MPRLYLIPSDLGNPDCMDPRLVETITPIEYLIVERLRTARRFLRKIGINETLMKIYAGLS